MSIFLRSVSPRGRFACMTHAKGEEGLVRRPAAGIPFPDPDAPR
jgi:hypothetical protein